MVVKPWLPHERGCQRVAVPHLAEVPVTRKTLSWRLSRSLPLNSLFSQDAVFPIMSTVITETPPSRPVISHENLLFDYPEADVILHSRDYYEFRVLKMYIVHSSPILGEKVLVPPNSQPEPTFSTIPADSGSDVDSGQVYIVHRSPILEEKVSTSPNPQPEPTSSTIPADADVDSAPATNVLPVVRLPIEGAILFSLLTYIFPVPPVLPSTVEQVMELLSVAQLYKMDVVLTHIRNHITQQEPPFIRKETAYFVYSLSHKYGLCPEALQAARCTLNFATLINQYLAKDSEEKLYMMPSVLHELWKYHQRVQSNLTSDLEEFIKSNAATILGDSSCESLTSSGIPSWLGSYIYSIGRVRVPVFLDLIDFHMVLVEHVGKSNSNGGCASCSGIPREKIRRFWGALTAVVHNSISKVRVTYVAACLRF